MKNKGCFYVEYISETEKKKSVKTMKEKIELLKNNEK